MNQSPHPSERGHDAAGCAPLQWLGLCWPPTHSPPGMGGQRGWNARSQEREREGSQPNALTAEVAHGRKQASSSEQFISSQRPNPAHLLGPSFGDTRPGRIQKRKPVNLALQMEKKMCQCMSSKSSSSRSLSSPKGMNNSKNTNLTATLR